MSKKTKAVLFEKNKIPRVFTNPTELDISRLRGLGEVVINPRLPKGVGPDQWELIDKRVQIGSKKTELGSTLQVVKEVQVETQPSFNDFHELEDEVEYIKLELLDKLNRTCIIGALLAFFLLLASFRTEIQQIIRIIHE